MVGLDRLASHEEYKTWAGIPSGVLGKHHTESVQFFICGHWAVLKHYLKSMLNTHTKSMLNTQPLVDGVRGWCRRHSVSCAECLAGLPHFIHLFMLDFTHIYTTYVYMHTYIIHLRFILSHEKVTVFIVVYSLSFSGDLAISNIGPYPFSKSIPLAPQANATASEVRG